MLLELEVGKVHPQNNKSRTNHRIPQDIPRHFLIQIYSVILSKYVIIIIVMPKYKVDGTGALAPEYDDPSFHLVKDSDFFDPNNVDDDKTNSSNNTSQKIINFNDAQRELLNNESNAANEKIHQNSDGISGAKRAESIDPINFTGRGIPKKLVSKKAKGKGSFKNKGAIGFIFALFIGVSIAVTNSQLLMPFSLLSQFRETFDSIKVSKEVRSKTMWTKQLENEEIKNPLHQRYFGFGGKKFKVRTRQKNKLKTQGIYVEENFANTGRTAMLFDDGSGKLKIIAAQDADIALFKKIKANQVDLSKIDADVNLSRFTIDTDNIVTFRTAYNDVPDFRNGYIKSSRTWRGSVGAWFDSITVKFLQSNKLTRNRFKNFQERVMSEQNGNTRSAAKKQVVDLMESDVDTLDSKNKSYDIETDEDGSNPRVNEKSTETETERIKTKGETKAAVKEKMNKIKEGKLGKASGYVSAGVNIACTVFDVIGAINLLITAQEAIQIIQLTTSYFEAIDKVKAGDGDGSPIHVLAEGLTTPKATTVFKNTTEDENELEKNEDVDVEEVTVKDRENATAMQSEGISALYSGKAANPNDPSIQNFNIGSRLNSILGHLSNSVESFAACAVARAAAAVIDLGIELFAIATCIFSYGITCIVNELAQSGTAAAASAAIGLATTYAINVITPLAVKAFTRDLISDLAGEDLGNALVSGANMYMGTNHLQGGGSLMSKEKYIAYAIEQKASIAENARFERETRSPFDVTSQYTFMGNLAKQIATVYTTKSPIFGGLSTASKMVSNSMVALLPSASAYNIAETLEASNSADFSNNCPYLASINAVGDAFCNPYIATDMSTIEMDPLEVVDIIKGEGGFDSDYNIEKNSDLAKYITYCNQRSSSFGVADGNIAANFSTDVDTGNSTANTIVNAGISSIPLVGDLADIVDSDKKLDNLGWITGQSCVASNDKLETATGRKTGVSWDKNKYYQRFIEDQRYLESIDSDYKSPITAFLDDYYEEHPLDTTYEGILARKAGMTKDEAIAYLEVLQEWNTIANYDPSTRYRMGKTLSIPHKIQFDFTNALEQTYYLVSYTPITWDQKQRHIAIA